MAFQIITAQEAAQFIKNGDQVGFGGFTPAGSPKEVPAALAEYAIKEHEAGREFQIGIFSGASTGDSLDGQLARAGAVKFRTPYQSNASMRDSINKNIVSYFDQHLSPLSQELRYGFYGKLNVAIIEACDVTEDGKITPTSGVGITPTIARLADKIIIELNSHHPKALRGIHDIYEPLDPPYRKPIEVNKPSDRIGTPYIQVDPSKIVGVVETNRYDETGAFAEVDQTTAQIGDNVVSFLVAELKAGRIPETFLPIQSGVGNVANAVLASLGAAKEIPAFEMYTEVIQDSVIKLMKQGRITFGSTCSLSVTSEMLDEIYANLDFYHDKLCLRPQEISNNPEVARRLGLITMNTALEADIFGNVNSTHVTGTKMMNGIGGSGDFTRSAYLSIFTCPSIAKKGAISAIVPMVSHVDHSEHSVNVIITEQGVADLRGKSPIERAHLIIDNCVHPDYKELLRGYLLLSKGGHTPHTLSAAFGFHQSFIDKGDMRLTDWSQF